MSIIQMRRGTAAQWTAANTVLAPGEIGVELDPPLPLKFKIGDGTTNWVTLPYTGNGAGGGPSTVPGPTGPASTVPGPTGPTGADSTVPGPTGPTGAQGVGVNIVGSYATAPPPASEGASLNPGDALIAEDTGDLYVWDGVAFVNAGQIRGPVGPTGGTGPTSTVPGPTGADSTVPGPTGPTGADSTVPGPTGADSTVPGPTGPTGADSTVPGPTGADSTVPGPTGADSTVPGPTGPTGADSTVPGPTGPAGADSTVPGPTGADSTVPGPTGPTGTTPDEIYGGTPQTPETRIQVLQGHESVWADYGGDFVLRMGEFAYNNQGGPGQSDLVYVGDGTTPFKDLKPIAPLRPIHRWVNPGSAAEVDSFLGTAVTPGNDVEWHVTQSPTNTHFGWTVANGMCFMAFSLKLPARSSGWSIMTSVTAINFADRDGDTPPRLAPVRFPTVGIDPYGFPCEWTPAFASPFYSDEVLTRVKAFIRFKGNPSGAAQAPIASWGRPVQIYLVNLGSNIADALSAMTIGVRAIYPCQG